MLRILIALVALLGVGAASGQGLPEDTWPAGTFLSQFNHGGRIVTFHNGYLYLGATDNQQTTIYDISNPQQPQLVHNFQVGNNGHTWHKIGNAFWRAYWNPELGGAGVPAPFADLEDMQNWQPFTASVYNFPFVNPPAGWPGNWLPTYPHLINLDQTNPGIFDAVEDGWWPPISSYNFAQEAGISATNRWRLGNLLFFTPGDDQSGMAVFDIGDPENPVLLDTLTGNIRQYTNAWQIWRHYVVLMNGDNLNGPDGNANALVIDISDPSNLTIAATIPYDDLPGRYVHFQDNYAFAGRFNRGTKFNMETLTVERVFTPPSGGFGDFQWVPLGHLLLISSSETNASSSYLFAHQDGLDTTPPSVGYHLPVDGAVNQPVTTVIGLVINEVLDSTTVNDQTIQVRPIDGDPIAGVVMDSNYDVVNFVPVEPLLPDTTYEVRIVGGGIRDVAGNAAEEYIFHFSTGDEIGVGDPITTGAIEFDPDTPVTAGETVQLSISAQGGTGALEYRWQPGDGSVSPEWQLAAPFAHVYTQPGTFNVQVQIRDQGGQILTRTRRIVVDPAPVGAMPGRSDSIAIDETSRRVWVVNPDHGSVAAIDADSLELLFEQPVCSRPRDVAIDGQGRPWIACHGDHRLVRLNPATGQPAVELFTGRGTEPQAIVFGSDSDAGYATLAGSGEVIAFDPLSGTEQGRVSVGPRAHALAIDGDGSRLLVSRLVSPSDSHGSIVELSLPALSASGEIELPLDVDSPDSGTAARGLPNYIAALALAPDNQRLWYAAKKDNILRGQWREGSDLSFETMVRVLIGSVDADAGLELVDRRIDIDDASLALALAPSPGGAVLFVALAGNHRVVAVDPWQGQQLGDVDIGFVPRGLAIDAQTGRLFARNDLDRSVSVIDVAAVINTGQPDLVEMDVVPTAVNEVLSAPLLLGKRIFYDASDTRMGADGYISCASCHLDDGGDGRVWDFTQQGEGLRRTIPLKGRAGLGHGFVHWSANFDEIQDFEIQIRNLFAGTGFLSSVDFHPDPLGAPFAGLSEDLDALAAYVSSLDSFGQSPYRAADGSLTTDGQAGRTLFLDAGCQRCHGGSAFSDSGQALMHDVGTLAASSGQRLGQPLLGLDTPTLRGLWRGGPYLHDGRADTLQQVFTEHNPSGAHGPTGSLSPQQIEQLVAYLRQIDDDEPASPQSAPILSWLSPDHDQAFAVQSTVDLVVSADPAVDFVEFLVDGQVIASLDSPPWVVPWTGGSGPAWLQARAGHAPGLTSLTRPVRVNFGFCQGPQGVLYQKWDGIAGAEVADLLAHPAFPDQPDHEWIIDDLFEGPTNFDDNYGARLTGWLCAPETGYYRFWIASDDNGSLRLSADADPAGAEEIAFHTGWTQPREWDKFPTQQSAEIWLEAGQAYWIEALMKEATGGDNVAVGWQLPDGTLERPTPASRVLRSAPALPADAGLIFRDGFES